jgi:hypothetical protein
MRKEFKIVFIGVVVIILLLTPIIEIEVVPAWRFQLIELDERPVSQTMVRQYWKHFSFEWNWFVMNEAAAMTDSSGFVEFPRRTITISAATWLLGSIWAELPLLNPHIRGGSFSFIQCDDRVDCYATYRAGQDLPSRVICGR